MEHEYLIKKWLNDELTPEELESFKALKDYQSYLDIVETAKNFKASEAHKVESFEKLKQKLQENKSSKVKPLWTNPFLRIASVIVIALGVYFSVFYNPITEVDTLAHQQTTVELPDASMVTLNAMSHIEYGKRHWNSNREINLHGEAFFQVEKGSKFDVVTSEGVVSVVGTQFSVNQRDQLFEVKCFEGVVKVVTKLNQVETLTAGKTFRILNGEVYQNETTSSEPQWLQNTSHFEKLPFKIVVAELERQYGIKVTIENFDKNPLFTGGFVHNNLDNALISVTQPLNLSYTIISQKEVVIYGHKK
ncbi:FecR family protein [Subsaxibacter sp. CAU 1640]|uniref:FecR family protein n=1 Tax=Subsaxibacter sp. CAU 1640 TaxID=2933271 RepID=UPI002002DC63|nr:FecR family protein [Subsaxibacter sp. CAU 1640]MCK7590097.1 FecR family protein [Subsaxibacter sp. CAU 1640]